MKVTDYRPAAGSLAASVVGYFALHTRAALSIDDVLEKFGNPASGQNVHDQLALAWDHDLIAWDDKAKVYRKGKATSAPLPREVPETKGRPHQLSAVAQAPSAASLLAEGWKFEDDADETPTLDEGRGRDAGPAGGDAHPAADGRDAGSDGVGGGRAAAQGSSRQPATREDAAALPASADRHAVDAAGRADAEGQRDTGQAVEAGLRDRVGDAARPGAARPQAGAQGPDEAANGGQPAVGHQRDAGQGPGRADGEDRSGAARTAPDQAVDQQRGQAAGESGIAVVRRHLLDTLADLRNPDKPMDIGRAKAVAEVATVLVNSAKVEVDYIRATRQRSGQFFGAPALTSEESQ